MHKNDENLFSRVEPAEPPVGLFDRIILAIKREQEQQHTRRLLFGFLFLLSVSLVVTPLSGAILVNQIKGSGISYFISTALGDLGTFFALWQNFGLAILESLPIGGIIIFSLSLAIFVFTLRLFLYRKKLLLGYLRRSFA